MSFLDPVIEAEDMRFHRRQRRFARGGESGLGFDGRSRVAHALQKLAECRNVSCRHRILLLFGRAPSVDVRSSEWLSTGRLPVRSLVTVPRMEFSSLA